MHKRRTTDLSLFYWNPFNWLFLNWHFLNILKHYHKLFNHSKLNWCFLKYNPCNVPLTTGCTPLAHTCEAAAERTRNQVSISRGNSTLMNLYVFPGVEGIRPPHRHHPIINSTRRIPSLYYYYGKLFRG